MQGLQVNVYRPDFGDCSNGGATAPTQERRYVYLFDPVMEGTCALSELDGKPNVVALKIVRRWAGTEREYLHAEPVEQPEEGTKNGPMFGGQLRLQQRLPFWVRVALPDPGSRSFRDLVKDPPGALGPPAARAARCLLTTDYREAIATVTMAVPSITTPPLNVPRRAPVAMRLDGVLSQKMLVAAAAVAAAAKVPSTAAVIRATSGLRRFIARLAIAYPTKMAIRAPRSAGGSNAGPSTPPTTGLAGRRTRALLGCYQS